jgi:hypothetical protein
MTPQNVTAWVQVASTLIGIGVPVVTLLHGWIVAAHPTLTKEQQDAAYVAILTDDTIRIAFAERAAQPTAA